MKLFSTLKAMDGLLLRLTHKQNVKHQGIGTVPAFHSRAFKTDYWYNFWKVFTPSTRTQEISFSGLKKERKSREILANLFGEFMLIFWAVKSLHNLSKKLKFYIFKCHFRAEVDKQELVTVVKFLAAKVEEMRTCHGLVEKHRHALSHSLAELETAQVSPSAIVSAQTHVYTHVFT